VTTVVNVRDVHLVSDSDWIDAADFCRLCRLDLDAVAELVDLGLIAPRGASPGQWQLPLSVLPRLAMAGRLMRDLGVNVSGVALVLELLDVQHDLERQIRGLEGLVQE
jgi:chaperone modulatory protein CbpM